MGTCVSADARKSRSMKKWFDLGGEHIKEGDYISLDGSTGNIYLGDLKTAPANIGGDFARIMNWADQFRTSMGA